MKNYLIQMLATHDSNLSDCEKLVVKILDCYRARFDEMNHEQRMEFLSLQGDYVNYLVNKSNRINENNID